MGVAILLAAVCGGLLTVRSDRRIVQLRRAAKKNFKSQLQRDGHAAENETLSERRSVRSQITQRFSASRPSAISGPTAWSTWSVSSATPPPIRARNAIPAAMIATLKYPSAM